MKISSKVHKQPGKVQYAVIDAMAGDKPFLAGIAIGDLRADPPTSTDVSNECLRRLAAAQDNVSNRDDVLFVEIRSAETAGQRVNDVAKRIPRHAAAAFYCLNSDCYDAVWKALNVSAEGLK
jgi:hypothetical protein